jgi:biopolymer transport protein TolR
VLIIIFLVIQPAVPTGLDASLPQSPTTDAQSAAAHDIVITVERGGTVRLNDEPVDLTLLHERLLQIFGARANSVVFIRGEKDLDFAQVAEVIDIAKGAGVNRIGLMTR